MKIDFNPSNCLGNPDNAFTRYNTKYPAKKPAIIPPRNPAPVSFARSPPTNPATIPGLLEIDDAINAANTGTIIENDTPPIFISDAAILLY